MDNLGILIQAILSLKDTTDSKNQIAKELPKLESQLQSDKNTRVKIVAGLDISKSKSLIQSQLNTLANQAKAPTIKVGIDTSGLNSVQGATQNITNSLQTVQTQAQQTASAVRDIGNVGISDNVFKKLLQDMQISKSVTNEYKQSLRVLANELTTAWDTRNEELYLAKLKEIINVIGNGQKSFKLFDKDSFDFKEITSQIIALKSAIGVGVDGNGRKNKFFIDDNLKKELAYIQGSDKAVRSLLNSLYGLGNWTFDERKFGFTNLRSQIDKASASADSLYAKFSNANFGGGNIANFITETAGQIDTLKAKLNTKDTLNGFLQLEMGIANADKQLEIMIADALKLKDFTSRRNDPLCWFEEIQTETQGLKEETAVIKEQTRATKELSAIRESVTRDAFGQQMSRTSVYGNAGYTRVSRYNENDELTSFTDTENYQKLEQQLAKIEEVRAKYNRLLADFKSSNSAIQSGLTQPIQQFETVLNGLGKTSSINDVKNAFEALKQSASEITKYLDTTNSSFNKATNAVNNYKNMDNILKEMTASFNNLVMKPENLRTELDGVKSKLIELQNLEKTEGGYTKAWAEKYREVNLELAQVKTNIELALKAEGSSQKADKNSAYQTQLKYLNKIKEETNTIISLKRKMVNAGDEEKAVYQHEITNAQKRIQYDVQQLDKKKLLTDEAKRLVNTYKEQIALQDKINSAKTSDKNVQAQSEQLKNYVTQVSKAITQLNSLQNSPTFTKNASNSQVTQTKQEITSLITSYQNLMTKLQGNITPAGLETVRTELAQLNARFNTATVTAKQFETELRNDNGAEKLAQRVALLKAQLEALAKANPKALTRFGNEINSLMATLNNNPDGRAVEQVAKSVQLLRREINNADLAGKTFFQNLKEKATKFTGWMSMTYAISLATRTIRNMITEVVNLDTALIDLKKTFKGTNSDLQDFYYEANNVAKQLGVTTEEVINTASSWSRLGYSTKEAAIAMSKYASMFKMISPNMSMEDSTDGLLSVMKAFDIEVNDVLDGIMSKINKVGNEFGTSNNEIVQMLMRSSSAMKEGNNTLAETIALETSAVEITRDYASVGTAYKTLAMRLRGYDEELETYSNDVQVLSGEIANLTKTAKNPNGVSLFKDEAKTEYKSTLEILRDIREVYDDLDDKTQAQLLEKIAGKRQGQIVAATLSNWDTVEKALVAMENADGSALNEMNTIMESISYRANIFKETLVGIAQGLFSQDFMKSMVDSGTRVLNVFEDLTPSISFILEQFATLLEFVTKLADAIGGIPLLIAGIGLKNVGSPKMFGLVLICQQ